MRAYEIIVFVFPQNACDIHVCAHTRKGINQVINHSYLIM